MPKRPCCLERDEVGDEVGIGIELEQKLPTGRETK